MKKEIERLQNQFQNILKGEITIQQEKSDPYDSKSPRCYRIYAKLKNNEFISVYGFCKNSKKLLEDFEEKLKEVR